MLTKKTTPIVTSARIYTVIPQFKSNRKWNVVKRNVKKIIPQNQQDLSRFMIEAIPENMLINLVQLIKCGYELVIESNRERIAY